MSLTSQIVWVEEHDKRSFLLDLMDASGLGAKDLDGEASRYTVTSVWLPMVGLYTSASQDTCLC